MEGVERWELFPLEKYGLFRFQQPGNSAASRPRSLRKCTRKTYGGVGTSYCPVSSRMAWAEGSSPLPELRDGLSYHSLESQLTTVADLCLITWAWTSALDTVWIPHVPDVSGSTQSFTLASLAEDSMVLGRPCAFWSAASFCFAGVGAPGGASQKISSSKRKTLDKSLIPILEALQWCWLHGAAGRRLCSADRQPEGFLFWYCWYTPVRSFSLFSLLSSNTTAWVWSCSVWEYNYDVIC